MWSSSKLHCKPTRRETGREAQSNLQVAAVLTALCQRTSLQFGMLVCRSVLDTTDAPYIIAGIACVVQTRGRSALSQAAAWHAVVHTVSVNVARQKVMQLGVSLGSP
jgi:hypothetical protein